MPASVKCRHYLGQMNLHEQLSRPISKADKERLALQASEDPALFATLMDCFLDAPNRVVQNAAWVMSWAGERRPGLLLPYLDRMADRLTASDSDAVKRNILRVLQYIVLPEHLWGLVADRCFALLSDPKEAVAIRVFAMTVLLNITREIPELKTELQILIEDQLPHGSAGFRSRGQKVLKELQRL